MYNPSQDLTAVQTILRYDATILSLLDLTGKSLVEIAKCIIKRSQWNDLVTNEKKLCVYFVPARRTRNESFHEEILEIDCHVPALEDYKAWQVQEQVFRLLHNQKANNKYLKAGPQLGELPTMSGLFCCGSRFEFYRNL